MGVPRKELPRLEPASRDEWRSWLESNHQRSPGVWLAVGKKGRTRTTLTYEQAVEEALAYGWIDSTAGRLDEDRYLQLMTPRKRGSEWAASNKERVARLLGEGRMAPAGIAVVEAAQADGSWTALDDVENLVIPTDLQAALAANPQASEHFSALPASARKMALYWIVSAKRPETRARRIAETIAAAAEGRAPR